MAGNIFNFANFTAASPYILGSESVSIGLSQPTASNNGAIVNLGSKQFTAAGTQTIWYDNTQTQGDVVRSIVKLSTGTGANSCGPCLIEGANGNGYMVLCNNVSTRLYRCVNSALGAQIGASIATILPSNSIVALEYRFSTSTLKIFDITSGSDVQVGGDFTDSTYAPRYAGVMSRYGYLQSFESKYIPNQTIVSINGGSPFTASQTTSSADTTGFTGLPASITSNVTGLTFSGIGGTTNAPTFTKSVRTDGAIYPKDGVTATVTFVNGAESASTTILCNKNADETKVVVALPINDDITCLFGAIFAVTGRSAANNDEIYHTVPAGMSDLVINPDGTMEVTNAGTFDCCVWTNATGVNYFYSVTVNDSGAGINVTSTSATYKIQARRI